jgi:hypothetical protein
MVTNSDSGRLNVQAVSSSTKSQSNFKEPNSGAFRKSCWYDVSDPSTSYRTRPPLCQAFDRTTREACLISTRLLACSPPSRVNYQLQPWMGRVVSLSGKGKNFRFDCPIGIFSFGSSDPGPCLLRKFNSKFLDASLRGLCRCWRPRPTMNERSYWLYNGMYFVELRTLHQLKLQWRENSLRKRDTYYPFWIVVLNSSGSFFSLCNVGLSLGYPIFCHCRQLPSTSGNFLGMKGGQLMLGEIHRAKRTRCLESIAREHVLLSPPRIFFRSLVQIVSRR